MTDTFTTFPGSPDEGGTDVPEADGTVVDGTAVGDGVLSATDTDVIGTRDRRSPTLPVTGAPITAMALTGLLALLLGALMLQGPKPYVGTHRYRRIATART
ncbi:MAG: hypothetical protein ABR520_07630 [Mycobacteriales bacterium]